MEPKEFPYREIDWKYYKLSGGTEELGKDAFEKLITLHGALQVACIKLLKTKTFKSAFRESLKNQLQAWINSENNYRSPFSTKQEHALVTSFDKRESKRIGISI